MSDKPREWWISQINGVALPDPVRPDQAEHCTRVIEYSAYKSVCEERDEADVLRLKNLLDLEAERAKSAKMAKALADVLDYIARLGQFYPAHFLEYKQLCSNGEANNKGEKK